MTFDTVSYKVRESLRLIEDLKFFLATAPANWQENQVIRRYYLNHDEGFVSCIFWNNLYFITGTDIVRTIVYKFENFGRKIIDRKKFEEGIFSDLRNLKNGIDSILEPPKSPFLDFLFKNSCLRTQKKQKVFFWFNVPHDKLMADALERDLKKEILGQTPTTISADEPAKSFVYDETKSLFIQLQSHMELTDEMKINVIDNNHKLKSNENDNDYRLKSNGNDPKISPFSIASSITLNSANTNISDITDNINLEKSLNPTDNQTFNDNDNDNNVNNNNVNNDTNNNVNDSNNNVNDTNNNDQSLNPVEEDFPLDYFDQAVNNDYINLDPNFHPATYGNLIDDNFESMIDPAVFMQHNPRTSSQLIYNDEYLIEQAQPPKSAKVLNFPIDDYSLPYQKPISAKFASFSRQTPSQMYFPQQQPIYFPQNYIDTFPDQDLYNFPGEQIYQPNFYEQTMHPYYPVIITPQQQYFKSIQPPSARQSLFNGKKRPHSLTNSTSVDQRTHSTTLDATALKRPKLNNQP